jgi:hypothetical protein
MFHYYKVIHQIGYINQVNYYLENSFITGLLYGGYRMHKEDLLVIGIKIGMSNTELCWMQTHGLPILLLVRQTPFAAHGSIVKALDLGGFDDVA